MEARAWRTQCCEWRYNELNSAHSNVQMQQQVDVVMDDRHATITDDISHTPFNAPSPRFFPSPRNAPTFQRTTPFHEIKDCSVRIYMCCVLKLGLEFNYELENSCWHVISLITFELFTIRLHMISL